MPVKALRMSKHKPSQFYFNPSQNPGTPAFSCSLVTHTGRVSQCLQHSSQDTWNYWGKATFKINKKRNQGASDVPHQLSKSSSFQTPGASQAFQTSRKNPKMAQSPDSYLFRMDFIRELRRLQKPRLKLWCVFIRSAGAVVQDFI